MKHALNGILSTLVLLILGSCTPKNLTEIAPVENPTGTSTPSLTGLQPGWWNNSVFYEIFVRSFKDSNGDGVGDFNGITQMLDYLNDGNPNTTNDLGITGIWLMPINESNSYHGYDVTNYYNVNPEYGTKEDFIKLVSEAHKRGIQIIMDLVLNHTGVDNPWFKASNAGDPVYRDWYVWSQENPGYSIGGGPVWFTGKNGYYYAAFGPGMPDLNLTNMYVTKEIDTITRYWLRDMHVDGFRLDAIQYYVEHGKLQVNTDETHAWLKNYFQFYKSIDPAAFTIGEAWTRTSEISNYIGDQVDIAFEFNLANAFVHSSNGPSASSATTLMEAVLKTYPEGQYGVFLTNHDQNRLMSVLGNDIQKAKLAAVMLLTSPGVPFLYYGEEIGMTGTKPDEDIRRPMQWTGADSQAGFTTGIPWRAIAEDYPEINVTTENSDPASLLNLYRQLINLRSSHSALRTGKTLVLQAGNIRLYSILRYDDNEGFLILINVDAKPVTAEHYNLSVKNWPLLGNIAMHSVMGIENPTQFKVDSTGNLDGYHPFIEIPPESFSIIQISH